MWIKVSCMIVRHQPKMQTIGLASLSNPYLAVMVQRSKTIVRLDNASSV